jgi:ABC-type nickel/cobalt efflux system permease component RcnA
VKSDIIGTTGLLRQKLYADLLTLLFAIFAVAWIPAALVLIGGDTELRPAFRVFWQLWPLALIPLCGFALCWSWRVLLQRKLKRLGSHEKSNNAEPG